MILAVPVVVFASLGILDDYYNWAIRFGILYLPNAVGQVSFPSLKQFVFALVPFLVFLFSFDLSVFLFMVSGILGVYPRWELFHFQPALPFLAITLSIFMFSNKNNVFKIIALILFIWHIVIGMGQVFGNETRFYEPQVRNIVSEIKKRNSREVYIANYWDNIYALTNTLPNKPLIPYIPWYLDYNNGKESILDDLKANKPDTVVIGERDIAFPEIYEFVDKFYNCKVVEKKIELCSKN